jgi:phosphate:Na+ symporter
VQTLLNLLASVALLVWGTHIVRTGILRVFGADLRRFLSASVSANRPSAFVAGLGVTALVQSSSATALIASSFVAQGMIALGPALVVMLGADVGTALLALLFSLDLRWLSPLLIFFGVVFFLSRKATRAGQIGRVAIGMGLIVLALQMVMQATGPITQAQGVKVIFASLSGDLMLDMLIGAVLTIMSWSSLAIVLLSAAFVSAGILSSPEGMALALGANLGSGLIALLVNLKQPGAGLRVAVGNLVFKVAGCIIFSIAMQYVIRLISNYEHDPGRQVLLFHVLFNVTIAAIFFLLADKVAAVVSRLIPDTEVSTGVQPRHLDPAALVTPALALANAVRETLRIGDTVEQMLHGMLEAIKTNDGKKVEEVIRLDDDVDRLYTAVKLYLTQVSREDLTETDNQRWTEVISLTINLEHVGDIMERIMEDLRDKKIALRLSFSMAGMQEITELHALLVANLRLGLSVFLNGDVESAQRLLVEKERFRDLERKYHDSHLERLAGQSTQSIETSSLHLDIISDMRRINSFFCSTAYPILEAAGKLRKSRLRGSTDATGVYQARPDLGAGGDLATPLK